MSDTGLAAVRVGIIGSFRVSNYVGVQEVLRSFTGAGFVVVSPAGTRIIGGEEFVRFATDDPNFPNSEVQTRTVRALFTAQAVYVIAPSGYIGRTTCYEIGRIIQRRQPIYFSEHPNDLPIHIPDGFIIRPERFAKRFGCGREMFTWLYEAGHEPLFNIEREIACHRAE